MKKLVIIPGGFHPFHAGHMALYRSVVEKFSNADVYVAATDDKSTRPFPFALKQQLANLAGVPRERFIQVKSPFVASEIKQMYDADNTVLIFVRSEKDATSQPQAGVIKKDGSAGYLQPYRVRGMEPMSKHAYMDYMPTVQFGGMTSATEIRGKWPEMDQREKTNLIATLYPATKSKPGSADKVVEIFDTVLGTTRIQEASIRSTATGMEIIPDGGLGTYDESTLVSNIARNLAGVASLLKKGEYDEVEKIMYSQGALESKIRALGQYSRFLTKRGQRPIAKDKYIDITQEQQPSTAVDYIEEKWSDSYKKSIDCDNPRGFSQRAHCAGRKK